MTGLQRGGAVGSSSGSYPEGRWFKSGPRFHFSFFAMMFVVSS